MYRTATPSAAAGGALALTGSPVALWVAIALMLVVVGLFVARTARSRVRR
jgi:hypothetical protein